MNRFTFRPRIVSLLALLVTACGGDAPDASLGTEARVDRPTFPLDADIWLADLERDAGGLTMSAPREGIHRAGYDNQPFFTPDGGGFWYTALDEHSGQTEIFLFRTDGPFEQVTQTSPESEYSPTPLPDGSGLSVVRVEADSAQRLWRVPFDGSEATVLLPAVAPVGYQGWIDASTVAVFVLGEPATLQIADLNTGTARVVAEGIGRDIRAVPGGGAVSFIQILDDGTAVLSRYDHADGSVTSLIETPANGDFHAWTPDGTVLMAMGSEILAWSPENPDWRLVADLSEYNVRISRLAVSPDGSQIALVVEPGNVTL